MIIIFTVLFVVVVFYGKAVIKEVLQE